MSTRRPGPFADGPGPPLARHASEDERIAWHLLYRFLKSWLLVDLGRAIGQRLSPRKSSSWPEAMAAPPVAVTLTDVRSPDMRSSRWRRT
jgi:hypothetical protein